MNRLAGRLLLALTSLAVASPAFAWGPQAHRVIAVIASDRLTPVAKAAVRELLHEGDSLADVANWADSDGHDVVPGSAPWHYVNVPITAPRYDARFCVRGNCVVEKIKHFRKILADRGAPKRERQHALLFLVHFVGDVHQPLHVGDNGDRGGNLTQIQFLGKGTNLHRLWDSDLIHHIGGNDRAWGERVRQTITYHDPEGSPAPLASGARLGEDYVKMADPILREQMGRAAVRLANELNAIFH
jgi:hypothetical protein